MDQSWVSILTSRSTPPVSEEFTRPCHAHLLIFLPIEMPRCRIHRDDDFGASRQRAFQKTVIRFVPDYDELS
jgi:hypothetical protein